MMNRKMPFYILKILSDRIENISRSYNINADTNNELEYSLGEIKKDLEKMINLIPRLKDSEDLLMQTFQSLERELDVIYDDHGQPNETSRKLNTIRQILQETNIKISDCLSKEEKAPILPRQQQTHLDIQMPKMSNNWLNLHIEESILDSPMMSNLQLSCDIPSINLMLCLLTFAVFPEKQLIKKKPLIYWWIGEGFITKSINKVAEEVGEEIFMELINKGFIQPSRKTPKNPIIHGCTVHPWIHRMLVSMAREANFFDLDTTGKVTNSYHNSRRFILDEMSSTSDDRPKGELLAIINVREKYPSFREDFFSKTEKIKVLQLGRWQSSPRHHIEIEVGKFLDKLKKQKQLKYLSLRGISRITTLPSSIVGCQNLEILDLRACHNLETLPFDIGSFKKLTHFDVSECYLLENLPKGLEKRSSLEVLKGFVVDHWRKNSCIVSDLSQLEKLRKLSINVGMVSKVLEETTFDIKKKKKKRSPKDNNDKEATLRKIRAHAQVIRAAYLFAAAGKDLRIKNLRILTITWQMSSKSGDQRRKIFSSSANKEEEKDERSDPFAQILLPNLEKLDLRCFPDKNLPLWISPVNLGNLKRLYIRGGNVKILVPMSDKFKPWKVEILRLNYLKNFRFHDSFVLEKEFPHLLYFERINCNCIADGLYDKNIKWRLDDGWQTLKSTLRGNQPPS
ncbi:RNI-like superfamily protein [Forsythia ovata]|uniref:RNI-like superfamily protein n=1 Tax=Forsythia ovata TaxID=205694 RepID=A0ABD1WCQ4_9LAMI